MAVFTYICVMAEDEAETRRILQHTHRRPSWHVDRFFILQQVGTALNKVNALTDAGISHNWVEAYIDTPTTRARGQVRFDHTGELITAGIHVNPTEVDIWARLLPDELMNAAERTHCITVLVDHLSWDNRIHNGNMHKLRNLMLG